VAESEALA